MLPIESLWKGVKMMQVRINDGTVEVSGYVNAVGRESRPLMDAEGYFTETIAPGAFARALQRAGDRPMLLNHEGSRILATEGEGMALREDAVGLYARAEVDDAEVVEKARSHQLRGWSFGFRPLRQRIEERSGMRHRIIDDMELLEVSLIDNTMTPAYAATSVFTRDDSPDAEFRTMELQDVEVAEAANEPPDLSEYQRIINSLN